VLVENVGAHALFPKQGMFLQELSLRSNIFSASTWLVGQRDNHPNTKLTGD
jgi:hypothetical protein